MHYVLRTPFSHFLEMAEWQKSGKTDFDNAPEVINSYIFSWQNKIPERSESQFIISNNF